MGICGPGNDTAASAVILDSSFLDLHEEVRAELPALKHVIVVGDPVPQTAHRFQDIITGKILKRGVAGKGA